MLTVFAILSNFLVGIAGWVRHDVIAKTSIVSKIVLCICINFLGHSDGKRDFHFLRMAEFVLLLLAIYLAE